MTQNMHTPEPGQARVDFGNVDQSTHPNLFVRYLEKAQENDALQMLKRQSYALLEATEGKHLLDIGCGIGDDVRALAQIVGSSGKAVGVDNSQTMLDEARKRSEGLEYPGEFHFGDIHHLPFADATFDGCRTERVLIHSNDPAQVLREMMRVVRPGSPIVVIEPDLDSVITHVSNHRLARKMTQWRCDSARNGWIGRQLPGLFRQCGLINIRIIPTVMTDFKAPETTPTLLISAQRRNILTEAEVAGIMTDFQQRGEQGQYFEFGVFFTVVGVKPDISS